VTEIREFFLACLNFTFYFRLIPPPQQPSNEVMQLLNEQSARELREKLEIEKKRQEAAENSKLAANALFSLNSAGGIPTSVSGGSF
jgi:hypothetical protein